ncbi:hypothetical protein P7K49_015019 [Saguinus oedipus]|uniref:Uncharacterized protein n=1 Tax=Saguinus oedipus TaxID=9490 RepID=A0ABQ9V8I1_SAGOE|nr:hypothetical protein P7K49_015019 [Saguinus oedipus]
MAAVSQGPAGRPGRALPRPGELASAALGPAVPPGAFAFAFVLAPGGLRRGAEQSPTGRCGPAQPPLSSGRRGPCPVGPQDLTHASPGVSRFSGFLVLQDPQNALGSVSTLRRECAKPSESRLSPVPSALGSTGPRPALVASSCATSTLQVSRWGPALGLERPVRVSARGGVAAARRRRDLPGALWPVQSTALPPDHSRGHRRLLGPQL